MPKRNRGGERAVVAVVTDKHANHVLGLCNPETMFERTSKKGERYSERVHTNELQDELWSYYVDDVRGVKKLAGKDPLFVIDLGDALNGIARPKEWVSTRLADQLAIGYANMAPWFEGGKRPTKVRIATGTASHDLGEGSGSQLVAAHLRDKYKANATAGYHYEEIIGGVRFDIAHHGAGPGIRNWLRGNVLHLYVQSMMMDMLDHGDTPPDVVLRGHYHQYVPRPVGIKRNGHYYETRAFICPPYCLIDDFANQAAQSPTYVTVGLLAFEIVIGVGVLGVHDEFMRTIDFRTREVLW